MIIRCACGLDIIVSLTDQIFKLPVLTKHKRQETLNRHGLFLFENRKREVF